MTWSSKRVAVTGAGGFIGSHLVEALARAGAEVTAVVRYNSRGDDGNLRYLDGETRRSLRVHRIDLADLDATHRALQDAEVVFHLAAFIGIPYSYVNPHDAVLNNLLATLNVLSVARDAGVERLVQTSTSEVYGSARQIPIPETHVLQPQSPYSASKIATDHVALSYFYSFNVPVTLVRPFNTFGPRQSARAVIPAVITQALAGKDIKVGVTTTTRDFVFVEDTVRGFMLAAESPASVGEVINIGTGQETSIEDAIRLIVRVVGRESRVVQDETRMRPAASEVSRLCADVSKAERMLGFRPEVAFEDGIRRTVAWIGAHLDTYHPDTYAI
ncbi:MAG: GDP-mannose 4,6-dehydratase [Gemmatimonadota bacterium]|nr:GDP-mannose 4,6-dehydratase [Gemmatimonadota bacterium]